MKRAKAKPGPAAKPKEWSSWVFIGLLVVLLLVFFYQVLLKQGFFWEDFMEENFPDRLFAARALARGEFPFWNPYIFGGLPFFAAVQTATLFPTNLLMTLALSGNWLSSYVNELVIILQLLVAGIGMFFFGRALGLSRKTAFFMGMVYMLNGRFIVHMTHIQMIQSFTFIPLLFLFLKRGFDSRGLVAVRNLVVCGLLLGISALGGYPQAMVIVLAGFLLYAVHQVVVTPRRAGPVVLGLVLVTGIFAVIALCQYLPTYVLFKNTLRGEYSYAEIVEGSFHPLRFITFLVPDYFGTTAQADFRSYFGPGPYYQYWEEMAYIGILPLVLAGFSLYRNTRKSAYLPLTLVVIPLLIALGRHFPLHLLLYKVVPFFSDIRTPAKFLHLTLFGVVWLAGIGLENVLNLRPRARMLVGAGVVLVLAIGLAVLLLPKQAGGLGRGIASGNAVRSLVFVVLSVLGLWLYLRKRLKKSWFLGAVVGLAFLDLFSFGSRYNSGKTEPEVYWGADQLVRFFKAEASREYIRVNTRRPEGLMLPRNMGYVQEFWSTEGYNPLVLARFVQARENLSWDRFLTIMNVKYHAVFDPASRRMGIEPRELYLPRARLFHDWEVIADKDSLLRVLDSPDFPVLDKVLLESDPGIEPAPGLRPESAPGFEPGTARISSYSINRIAVDVETDRAAVLVLSENYYPNWQVLVRGKKAATFPVDHTLRGCVVLAGKHRVEFVYEERLFGPLLVLALTVLAGGVGFVAATRPKRSLPGRR